MYYTEYNSPIGPLLLVGDGQCVHKIVFPQNHQPAEPDFQWVLNKEAFDSLSAELDAYFIGTLQQFTVPLNPGGTEFQQTVWQALRNVEYGATCSYRDIATAIGKPKASRAVGSANGANPIPIVIPCHRIIGTNGTLTGFAGGLHTKHWLLTHEAGEQSLFPFDQW